MYHLWMIVERLLLSASLPCLQANSLEDIFHEEKTRLHSCSRDRGASFNHESSLSGHAVDTVVVTWYKAALQAIRHTHPGSPIVARRMVSF